MPDIISMIPLFIEIAVLCVLLFFSVRLYSESNRSVMVVFLIFVYALWLFTILYWLIYDFMRPESRMPFAVNEIGEAAVVLLMAAIIGLAVPKGINGIKLQIVGTILFSLCNVALWIAWTGEWGQDILFGAAYIYFMYIIACALTAEQSLSKKEWIGLGIGCMLLILFQGSTFFVEQKVKNILEICSYLLLVAGTVYWAYKFVIERRNRNEFKNVLGIVFALLGWILTAKFMSDGIWYSVFQIGEIITLPLIHLSVRKVVVKV